VAGIPVQAPLGKAYAPETLGTARHVCRFCRANGDEEAVMYIGIGGLILLILLLVVLF
jgi:hypothetical protein